MRDPRPTKICLASTITLLSATLVVSLALAQSGSAMIHGSITFDSHVAACERPEEVVVELIPIGDWDGTRVGTTPRSHTTCQSRMSFDFGVVSMGDYELRISALGFETYSAIIWLPSDSTTQLHVRVHAAGP